MKIKNNFLIIVFILILGVSCKDSIKHQTQEGISLNDISKSELKVKTLFPDTIYQYEKYSGFITFESPFDSVTELMFDDKYNRRVVLKLQPESFYSVDKDFYEDSLSINRFVAIDNRRMPYYGVSFSEVGIFELKGELEDSYLLNENYPDSVFEIAKRLKFLKRVVVIK